MYVLMDFSMIPRKFASHVMIFVIHVLEKHPKIVYLVKKIDHFLRIK
jgi:hypothetical protein